MKVIVGLGEAGCNIADQFAKYPQYKVYKIDTGLESFKDLVVDDLDTRTRRVNNFDMPRQGSSEDYEKNCPFMRGFFMATDNTARQSLIADAVPYDLVMNAVALMSATQNVMRIGGVMLSGLLIALLGVTGTFVIIAIVYLITVIATYLNDIPPIKRPPMEGFKTIKHDLAEGFRFALRQS